MKEQIIEIISRPDTFPDQKEIKAREIIVLINQRLLEKAKESDSVFELLNKMFIST